MTTLYIEGGQQLNFAMPIEWLAELPERHAVMQGLARFDQEKLATDPTYARKRPILDKIVYEIRTTKHHSEWLAATESAYSRIPDQPDIPAHTPAQPSSETSSAPKSIQTQGAQTPSVGRWVEVYSDRDKTVLLDTYSIAVERSGVISVWERISFSEPFSYAARTDISHWLLQSDYDCAARTSKLRAMRVFAGEEQIASHRYSKRKEAEKVLPGSVVEASLERVCMSPVN